MQDLEPFLFGRDALIPAIFAGHIVLLPLLQDNIFALTKFRGSLRSVRPDSSTTTKE
jgi:hypothetical protein